jgi:acyl-CoA synthetase (AMP-forming)/AMP-acid ligase II
MNFIDAIFYWAKTDPHRRALIQPEMVTTYQGLADAIESIGDRIDRLNIARGEPVAVSLANPSFVAATVFALLRSGYSAAPVNAPLYPHLHSAGVRNLIYDSTGLMVSGGRNIRFDMSWLPAKQTDAGRREYRKRRIENLDMIFFTSGTTGLPKKIVQTGRALEERLNPPVTPACGPYQNILIMPGLMGNFGINHLCEALNLGRTAYFAADAEGALSLIDLHGVELVIASVVQALSLVEVRKKKPYYRVDSLKAVMAAGGKMGPEARAAIRETLCRNLISGYGSTEAGFAAMGPVDAVSDIRDAVGYVLPLAEVDIVDETGRVLPAGAEGLIRIRTAQLIENLKAPGSSGMTNVRDQWFYPGDIGSLTPEGILCVSGRSSDVINRGGVKVSGNRIEEVLQGLPEIKEAAACGVTAASGLEEIWVAVVAKANRPVDVETIKQSLKEHEDVRIAPDEVFVLDELPRGDIGKVQKHRLKELLLSRKRDA